MEKTEIYYLKIYVNKGEIMRTKEKLFEIENITIILQYLYVNPEHIIKYDNGLTTLEIYMNDAFEIYAKNLKFEDLPPLYFTSTFGIPYILGLIDILKDTKSDMEDVFENKWEEILKVTKSNVGLNHLKGI